MSIKRSLSANALGVMAVAAAGFIAMLVLARRLPVENFGTVSVSLMVANAVAVFDGVRPVVVFEATRANISLSALHASVTRLFMWTAAIATFVTLAVAASLWRDQIGMAGLALLGLTVFLYFPAACNWGFLDARNDTVFTGIARSAAWVTVYVVFILLAFVSVNPVWYLVPLAGMNAILALAYRLRLGVLPTIAGARAPSSRELLRRSMDNLGVNIAATTIGTIDRVVLSAVAGMRDVGLYSAQFELSTKPSALLRVANSVLFPAAAAIHADGRSLTVPWLRMTLAGSQALVAAAAVAISLRQEIIALLLGPEYARYSDVFGFLMIALALQFFGYACPVLLNARGDFALQRRLYLVAAVAMAASAVPVTSSFGIVGLAALYLAVRSVDLVMFFMTLRSASVKPKAGPLWIHFAIATSTLMMAWSGSPAWTLFGAAMSALTAAALLWLPPDRLVRA